jgi:hypothetical protein
MTKRERTRAARAMATAMRVVGDKECKGDKVMAMATRIEGERTATATNGTMVMATKRIMATATMVVARAMVTATRVVGKQIDVALINYRIFLHHDNSSCT